MRTFCNVIMIFCSLCFFSGNIYSQTYYWVGFTDKNNTPYTIEHPEEFLSERALQRRANQDIPIEENDLPVNPDYINQVLELGAEVIHSSKWLNGITVKCDSAWFPDSVINLDFIQEVIETKNNVKTKSRSLQKFRYEDETLAIDSTFYGEAVSQVFQINGHYLHENGFKGEGIHIAVLDGGFYHVDQLPAFDSLWINNRILGYKDFVDSDTDFFSQSSHGMKVLSIMGSNMPGELIGTAPEASYWLLRSEDVDSEYLIEEYNWIAAAEFADSAGADIINSSLGYYLFDDPSMDHSYSDMDGNTTHVSIAADIAAQKGMMVFCSAGNEGNKDWHYLIAPSDGDDVVAVGAVDKDSIKASFSSFGPSSDGDVKPNVSGMGKGTSVQSIDGDVEAGSGTSYSSPVIAGMAACLWQETKNASAKEVKEAIEQSANQYYNPDSLLGYGIPDFKNASYLLGNLQIIEVEESKDIWALYPNPVGDYLYIKINKFNYFEEAKVEILNINGVMLLEKKYKGSNIIYLDGLNKIAPGIIFLRIITPREIYNSKMLKAY